MGKLLCNNCVHYKVYVTGSDEYPQNVAIAYCSKFFWHNADPHEEIEALGCKQYITPAQNATQALGFHDI